MIKVYLLVGRFNDSLYHNNWFITDNFFVLYLTQLNFLLLRALVAKILVSITIEG